MADSDTTDKEWFHSQGYVAVKRLSTGEWLGVHRMLYTTGLCLMSMDSWRTRYCYENFIDCVVDFVGWDGKGDPPGPWIKQKPEDRLNPAWVREAREELHGR